MAQKSAAPIRTGKLMTPSKSEAKAPPAAPPAASQTMVAEGGKAVKSLISSVGTVPARPPMAAPQPPAPGFQLYQIDANETEELLATAKNTAQAMGSALAPFWQAQSQFHMRGTQLAGRSMNPKVAEFFRSQAALLGKVSVFVYALEAARQTGLGAVISSADLDAIEALSKGISNAQEYAAQIVS